MADNPLKQKGWLYSSDNIVDVDDRIVDIDPGHGHFTGSQTERVMEDEDVENMWYKNGHVFVQMKAGFFEKPLADQVRDVLDDANYADVGEWEVTESRVGDDNNIVVEGDGSIHSGVIDRILDETDVDEYWVRDSQSRKGKLRLIAGNE